MNLILLNMTSVEEIVRKFSEKKQETETETKKMK